MPVCLYMITYIEGQHQQAARMIEMEKDQEPKFGIQTSHFTTLPHWHNMQACSTTSASRAPGDVSVTDLVGAGASYRASAPPCRIEWTSKVDFRHFRPRDPARPWTIYRRRLIPEGLRSLPHDLYSSGYAGLVPLFCPHASHLSCAFCSLEGGGGDAGVLKKYP